VEISADLGFAQLPHGHSRDGDSFEQYLFIPRHSNRGVEFVAVTGECTELLLGLRAVGRLIEDPKSKRQGLIRADDQFAGLQG